MGLAIEVGYLADMLENDEEGAAWFREELAKLNSLLSDHGLAAHREPEAMEVFSAEMHGYSGIHHLRRIAAHLSLNGGLPEPGDVNAAKDPVLQRYYEGAVAPAPSRMARWLGGKPSPRFDHLIQHSDCEGFYVPQDFPHVLAAPDELELTGGIVGSSQQLLRETEVLAHALELPLGLDPEAEEVWAAADSQGVGATTWQRYGIESFVCLRLYRAAKLSIASGALIVFS